jgi:hypothetical protein
MEGGQIQQECKGVKTAASETLETKDSSQHKKTVEIAGSTAEKITGTIQTKAAEACNSRDANIIREACSKSRDACRGREASNIMEGGQQHHGERPTTTGVSVITRTTAAAGAPGTL